MLAALLPLFVAASTGSHWDPSHRLILTERGSQTVLGGTVDGITMVQIPLLRELGGAVRAYVPTTTSHGTQVRWKKSCVFIRPNAMPPADLTGDDLPVLQAALDDWQGPTRGCGFLQLKLESREAGEVGFDYVNRVVYRDVSWCIPAHDGVPESCHSPGAIGLTTLFYRDLPGHPDDGELLDADVELNEVYDAFGVCDADGGCLTNGTGMNVDLQNIFTHELGHVLGLDHTCNDGTGVRLDGAGQPVPSCMPVSQLPATVTGATMYPFSDPAEISKRVLSADDIEGFCSRYPLAHDPNDCTAVSPLDAGTPDAGTLDAGTPDAGSIGQPMSSPHGCGCNALDTGLGALALLGAARRPGRDRERGRS